MFLQGSGQRGHVPIRAQGAKRTARRIDKQLLWQHPRKQSMHAGDRITHRHRTQGVTVIATARRDEALLAGPSACLPVLQGHFHRHLDRYRTGIGKEHRLQGFRRQLDQQTGQLDGGAMCQSAEHDMRHVLELAGYRRIQHRVIVAMDGAPPRRHAVDQFATVGQTDAHAVCRPHRVDRQVGTQRAVGVPDMRAVSREPVGHGVRIGNRHECRSLSVTPGK